MATSISICFCSTRRLFWPHFFSFPRARATHFDKNDPFFADNVDGKRKR